MLVATFRVPHGAVALAETFRTLPKLTLEAERVASHSSEWVMPCVWVRHADFDAVDDALSRDASVERVVESSSRRGSTR